MKLLNEISYGKKIDAAVSHGVNVFALIGMKDNHFWKIASIRDFLVQKIMIKSHYIQIHETSYYPLKTNDKI